jgi:hypothetical protein
VPDPTACAASWSSYSTYFASMLLTTPTGWHTSYGLDAYETFKPVGDGDTYTACDGIPRFRFSSTPTATITSTFYVNNTIFNPPQETLNPRPNCDPDRGMCDRLWQKYNSNSSAGLEEKFDITLGAQTGELMMLLGWCGSYYCGLEAGEEVVLIYWPPNVTSRDICAVNGHGSAVTLSPEINTTPVVITTSAITFRGQDLYKIDPEAPTRTYVRPSVLMGPFTFTSPTVYMAHHPISRNTQPFEIIRPAGIEPIRAEDIITSVGIMHTSLSDVVSYVQKVAKGKYEYNIEDTNWNLPDNPDPPFDFGHLENPVPAHIFYDDQQEVCYGSQTHGQCATITDDTYRPKIGLKNKVWLSILSNSSGCWRPQLRDPPIALIPVSTLESPSLRSCNQSTQSQPEGTVASPVPMPTIGAQQTGSPKKNSAQRAFCPSILLALDGLLLVVFSL